MGGEESKLAGHKKYDEALANFSPEERSQLELVYKKICGIGHSFGLDEFLVFSKSALSHFQQREVYNELLRISKRYSSKTDVVTHVGFTVGMANLLKGSVSDKAALFFNFCGGDGSVTISRDQLIKGVGDLMNSYILVETNSVEFSSWRISVSSKTEKLWSDYLIRDLNSKDKSNYDISDVEKWLSSADMVLIMFDAVLHYTFQFFLHLEEMNVRSFHNPTIPFCLSKEKWGAAETMLEIPYTLFLNHSISLELRRQWRILFSSVLHGESFMRLVEHVGGQGPCIVVIRDKKGHIFGGFASQGFVVGPKFTGDQRCFLFTLYPKMEAHWASGYNKNYCYLNWRQETLRNGIGFGGMGNDRDFGLWIDGSFQKGESRNPCTTFNSPLLSGTSNFDIDSIEIWGVGPKTTTAKEARTSALDIDPEAKAMLEMIGKGPHSEGMRESDATATTPTASDATPFF